MTFNRAAAEDARARFPERRELLGPRTPLHFAQPARFKDRLNAPRIPAKEIASLLGITRVLPAGPDKISAAHQARLVMGMIRSFCYSNAAEVMARHMARSMALLRGSRRRSPRLLLPFARQAWEDICFPSGKLPFKHDHYLKMWALTRPAAALWTLSC